MQSHSPTTQKSHIAVAQNASGRNLHVPVYRISSGLPGPKVYIQSSIHGAEVQGNVVIYHLIQALQRTKVHGEIVLVPNCNPVGTNIKAGEYTLGRFDPVNGTNWNRGYFHDPIIANEFADSVTAPTSLAQLKQAFREQLADKIQHKLSQSWGLGLAQQLNLTLQKMAVQADIVLDLHNGPVSSRHVYIPEYAKANASLFSMPHCIFIPNVFAGALDEACFSPWWSLQDLLEQKFSQPFDFGVEAYTLEMGSQELIDFAEGKADAEGILAFLAKKGVLAANTYTPQHISRYGCKLADYKTMYTDFGGMVEYCVKPSEKVAKGEVMAKVLNIDELDNQRAVSNVVAPCDLIAILHFPSASVLSGTQLYKCLTNYEKLSS